ncbi:hypothetical protein ABT354_12560 [Streptomyces sp. NPDC000594]|uniref:hypothetical protein n=1 Tax=Streptomyces sp. NPDC000594 TaxID=3154261 RepID=UPI003328A6C6
MRENTNRSTSRRVRAAVSAAVAVCAVTVVLPGAAWAGTTDAADGALPRVAGVERLSVTTDGIQADDNSADAAISPEGDRVVFSSHARNLRPGDTGTGDRVYVRDRRSAQTTRLGIHSPLEPAVISPDGGYVAYPARVMRADQIHQFQLSSGRSIGTHCSARACRVAQGADGRHLVYGVLFNPPEPNQRVEVYDRDANTRQTIDIIHNIASIAPSISADGRFVAYQDGVEQDVFLWDRTDNTPAGPIEGPAKAATLVQLSAEGGKVVYLSGSDTYVHDTGSGTAQLVPNVKGVAIDPTGRYLLYAPNGTGGPSLVLRDLRTGTDETVSDQPASARAGAVSANGRDVVFQSAAADIVPGDSNGKTDVFVRTFH